MMRKYPLYFMAAVLTLAFSGEGFAQDEVSQSKPDLSHPELISRPPMDPFSLSYVPEAPQGVQNIDSAKACRDAGGRWGAVQDVEELMSSTGLVMLHPVGCQINGVREGRWMFSEVRKSYDDLDEKTAHGYVWMKDGKREGYQVILNNAQDFVRRLTPYSQGQISGTAFEWNEMGALSDVTTYKQGGVLDGKYERYLECLPTAMGKYENGKPVGTWDLYAEPGMISLRRYYDRRALRAELPEKTPENVEAYWSEWFNGEGVKIAEGYSVTDDPELMGERIGKIQLYTTAGNKWLAIQYDHLGKIDDKATFDLCKIGKTNEPDPAYLNYDHENFKILCKNADNELTQEVDFYGTGELWKIIPVSSGKPHGTIVEYHPSGKELARYAMKMGTPDGEIEFLKEDGTPMGEKSVIIGGTGHFKSWWYNGFPQTEGDYLNGSKNGTWKTWYDTGSLESESEMKNGAKSGTTKNWFNNGVLSSEVEYLLGTRNGIVTGFYTDGHVAYKYTFRSDRPTGMCYDYTHAGQVSYDTDYSSGHGPYPQVVYYTDGKKQASGKAYPGFGEPTRDGEWEFFLKNGTKWYSAEYSANEVQNDAANSCSEIRGEYKINAESREVGCQVCAVNRQAPLSPYRVRENEWEWYSENGTLEKKGAIHMGHVNGKWEYYYPNGKSMLIGSYDIDRRVGRWTGFYEDGQKKFDGQYDNGVEVGKWSTYHPVSGEVSSSGDFTSGKRNGEWTWHYPGGQLQEKGTFVEGKETGTWTQYYENGQKKGEGEFVDGVREGKWTWWREDGRVWRTAKYVKGKEQIKK